MPNQIKQETSSSAAPNESPDTVTVPKEEFNRLKRKLEETEPELRECKRKMEEAKAELEDEKKKSKLFKSLQTLVATDLDVKFKPKRVRIPLILPNFAKLSTQKEFEDGISSEPVDVAGFQWKLWAGRSKKKENAGWMNLILFAHPPENYKGQFEIGIDFSSRLFNTFSAKDMHKELKDHRMSRNSHGHGAVVIAKFVELKDLLDSNTGFLQNDGSIQLEADFLLKTTTIDHFLVD